MTPTRQLLASRRGNALILALSLGTLLGFSALSIDIGMVRVADTELQAAVDSAALGGVGYLDGTIDGMGEALTRTKQIGGLNPVLGATLAISDNDVTIGVYDADETPSFVPYNGAVHEPTDVNAVRVVHTPTRVRPGLAHVAFGRTGYTIRAESLAIREKRAGPAADSNCFLPIAIPECLLASVPPGTNPAPMEVMFSPAPTDNVGWADPDGNPNSNDIRQQLNGQCSNGTIAVGDPLPVSNGTNATALQEIRDILNNDTAVTPGVWPPLLGPVPAQPGDSDVRPPNWGNVISGPIAIVDAGCPNPSFVGSPPITGIGYGFIFDSDAAGADKNIWVQIDLVNPYDVFGNTDDTATGPNVFGLGDPQLVIE